MLYLDPQIAFHTYFFRASSKKAHLITSKCFCAERGSEATILLPLFRISCITFARDFTPSAVLRVEFFMCGIITFSIHAFAAVYAKGYAVEETTENAALI